MGKKHPRHVVTIYGEKLPFTQDNMGYYSAINDTIESVSQERQTPLIFSSRLNEKGDALADVIAMTREDAEALAQRLRDLGKYERVDIESQEIDISKFMPGYNG